MTAELFLAGAIVLQVAAAVLAFRLIRATGRLSAWILISIALVLMAVRRIIPFLRALLASGSPAADPLNEFIGLVLSAFMLAGIAMIGPIFEKIFRSELALKESERRFRSYFELPLVGVAIVARDKRWATVNDRLCSMLGFTREELGDLTISALTYPEDAEREAALDRGVGEGKADGYSLDKRLIGKDGKATWVSQAVRCVRDSEGGVSYSVVILQDISERKAAEEGLRHSLSDKEALLRELYHRTKNNMQMICSLLHMESAHIDDPRVSEEFRLIENRIFSMSLVHEKLYLSRDLSNIDLSEYVGDLMRLLMQGYGFSADRIDLDIDLAGSIVPIDTAIPLGLILNELITNSLKHAFPDGKKGRIRIAVARKGSELPELVIADDGVGPPPGFDPATAKGMGLPTVYALANQLGGNARLLVESGVEWRISFREAQPTPRFVA